MREERPRRVVPKWRPSAVTAGMPEARSTRAGAAPDLSRQLAAAQSEFDQHGGVPVASELMFLAHDAGASDVAKRAAGKILEHAGSIKSRQLLEFAERVVSGVEPASIRSSNFVRAARQLLAVNYRNPVLLVDIALELTSQRQEKAAERYIRAAVGLAPQSRFVVRSAARYYLHIQEHQRAHDILLRSPLLQRDPWVQASEIAIATVRGRTSALAKRSLRFFLDTKTAPIQHAELMSAVATVELISGAEKNAKKLFQRSLQAPNDNSLAQAEWAANRLGLVVDDRALLTPMSFEALSNNAYRKLQLDDAIRYALDWATDEPFASRPAEALGHYYCEVGDYANAHAQFQKFMRLDDSNRLGQELNLVFTRIQLGEVDEAYQDLIRLSRNPHSKNYVAHFAADVGALAYATGDFAVGREYYRRAIQIAKNKSEPITEALARAYFARAAKNSSDPNSDAIRNEMMAAVEKLPSPGALYIMRGLETSDQQAAIDRIAQKRVATRKWAWDQVTNTLKIF